MDMMQPEIRQSHRQDAYDWICVIDLILRNVFIWVLNASSMGTHITQSVALMW